MNIEKLSHLIQKDISNHVPTGQAEIIFLGDNPLQAQELMNNRFDTITLTDSTTGAVIEFEIMDMFVKSLKLITSDEEDEFDCIPAAMA